MDYYNVITLKPSLPIQVSVSRDTTSFSYKYERVEVLLIRQLLFLRLYRSSENWLTYSEKENNRIIIPIKRNVVIYLLSNLFSNPSVSATEKVFLLKSATGKDYIALDNKTKIVFDGFDSDHYLDNLYCVTNDSSIDWTVVTTSNYNSELSYSRWSEGETRIRINMTLSNSYKVIKAIVSLVKLEPALLAELYTESIKLQTR